MLPAFGLTLALMIPGAPVPKDVAPVGPAPYILHLKSENDGKVRFTVMRTEKVKVNSVHIQVGPNGQQVPVQTESEVTMQKHVRIELGDLKDLKVYTPEGKEVDVKDAAKRLSETTMAIASVNGQKVDPGFLKLFKDDVLILVSPDLTPTGSGVFYNFPPAMPGGMVRPMPAVQLLPVQLAPPPLPAAPPLPAPPKVDPPVFQKPDVKKD